MTPVTKFALPGGFLVVSPTWILLGQDAPFGYWPAVFWTAACAFLVWWTLPIKKVVLRGTEFVVSNYLRDISVPVSTLVRINEDRENRTPNIAMYFDPPTAFGPKIRVVTPMGQSEFDRIAGLLRDIIATNARCESASSSGAAAVSRD